MSNRTTSPTTQSSQTGQSSTMTISAGQSSTTAVPHDKIAKRAYEKWVQRGCMHGTHQQDWLEAEAEIRTEMSGKGVQNTQQSPAGRPAQAMPAPAVQKTAQRR